eukprot:CAMPEP_0167779350 /NCGR_PEP_ID=MMETSP0111_2-20121227/4758_1 /TAXON_ID=91324 /ORGANISM="Lotharella globosa, Strain CCCM811" /LENGTH=298 /DNA_ID=CAMNT_0007669751 /DNA_START=61 /DNA_END=957 /DNA_ORIENTATION=-
MTPALVVVKDGATFEEFLAKCAQKLKLPEKKFTRCFYMSNAAEIDDPEDLMPDDKLFVSEGEDYKQKADGFLSGGLSALASGASTAYSAASTYAKSKMSEETRKKFEDAEAKAAAQLTPMYEKVKEVTAPAVEWTDKKLEVASEKITEKKKEFMASETGVYLQEKVMKPASEKSKELFTLASAELKKASAKSKDQMGSLGEYMNNVKTKMGQEWDEKLAPAVKAMYEQAKENAKQTGEKLKEQGERLQKTWHEEVEPVLREKMNGAKSDAKEKDPAFGMQEEDDDLDDVTLIEPSEQE